MRTAHLRRVFNLCFYTAKQTASPKNPSLFYMSILFVVFVPVFSFRFRGLKPRKSATYDRRNIFAQFFKSYTALVIEPDFETFRHACDDERGNVSCLADVRAVVCFGDEVYVCRDESIADFVEKLS